MENWIITDTFFIAVILAASVLGFVRGLVSEIIPAIFWLFALILSLFLSEDLADMFVGDYLSMNSGMLMSACIIEVGVLAIGFATNMVAKTLLALIQPFIVLRLFGVLLGAFKGCIIVITIIYIVNISPFKMNPAWMGNYWVGVVSPTIESLQNQIDVQA